MSTSNETGRAHRSMQSAFGPYTSSALLPIPHKPSRFERIADAMFAITLGIVGCAILVTWVAS